RQRVERLVKARADLPDGIRFRAIQQVALDDGRIALEFLHPVEPSLDEVSNDHFVSCYLYPNAAVPGRPQRRWVSVVDPVGGREARSPGRHSSRFGSYTAI